MAWSNMLGLGKFGSWVVGGLGIGNNGFGMLWELGMLRVCIVGFGLWD
jgi:hypothetical protein